MRMKCWWKLSPNVENVDENEDEDGSEQTKGKAGKVSHRIWHFLDWITKQQRNSGEQIWTMNMIMLMRMIMKIIMLMIMRMIMPIIMIMISLIRYKRSKTLDPKVKRKRFEKNWTGDHLWPAVWWQNWISHEITKMIFSSISTYWGNLLSPNTRRKFWWPQNVFSIEFECRIMVEKAVRR